MDVEALRHNVRAVRGALSERCELMAVVKADGYGHGLEAVARAAQEAGASWVGVGTVDEGAAVRAAGVQLPILVLLPVLPAEAPVLVEHGLTATVASGDDLLILREAARQAGRRVCAHLFVDCGIGRLGVHPDELRDFEEAARSAAPELRITGAYGHFARAHEPNKEPARREMATFLAAAEALRQWREPPSILHLASSASVLDLPESQLDLARVGTLLYGVWWPGARNRNLDLRPTWELRTRVIAVREVRAGTSIGYGAEYTTSRPTAIATVPVGHAHGLTQTPVRSRVSWREVARVAAVALGMRRGNPVAQVRGFPAPIVGRVSMDQCCLDVSGIPDCRLGDPVTLPCRMTSATDRLPKVHCRLSDPW